MNKKPFIFLLATFSFHIFTQERIKDMGGWFSPSVNYKFSKKHSIIMRWRIKQYENFTQTNSWYIDIGYAFKISRNWRISAHYNFNPSRTNQNYFRNIHRYYLRMDYKKSLNKYITFHNRTIVRYSTHLFLTDFKDNGYKPYYRTDLRERIGVSYNLSSSDKVFIHNEWMIVLSQSPIELKRNRFYCGYEKKVSKTFNLETYFVFQSTFHDKKSPGRDYFILGLDMNFNLK